MSLEKSRERRLKDVGEIALRNKSRRALTKVIADDHKIKNIITDQRSKNVQT